MKYKVLIVEDDQNFRYAIRELIPWERHRFEIIGEAVHGRQALDLVEQSRPDMVITDMDMPIMNGVELTRRIKECYPHIQVVALSAYEDFDFVKESMRLGAEDYILKQSLYKEDVIDKLVQIREKKQQQSQQELFNIEGRKEFQRFALQGTSMGKAGLQFAKRFPGRGLMVFLVDVYDDDEKILSPGSERAGLPVLHLERVREKHWLVICQEKNARSRSEFLECIYHTVTFFEQAISDFRCTGYSELTGTVEDLPGLCQKAEKALEYEIYYPGRKSISFSDIEGFESRRVPDYIYKQPESIRGETPEEMEVLLDDFEEKVLKYKPAENYINKSYVELYRSFCQRILAPPDKTEELELYDQLSEYLWLEGKREFVQQKIMLRWEKHVVSYQGKSQEIIRAIEYVYGHYMEELTLGSIASQVGLSENYFSNLFKAETGENVTSFINRVRIGHAREILDTEVIKVNELAKRTGYQNPAWFRTVFRKITGYTVSEYKNRKR